MKKLVVTFVVAFALVLASFTPVSADPGGAPGAHGVDGRTFGSLVSGLAQMYPGAVADHVSNSGGNGGGMPAAHGVDGRTFGAAVSGLAQSAPGAVASHVSGK
jgi:hypothetical protein